jgi:hypothetical protein
MTSRLPARGRPGPLVRQGRGDDRSTFLGCADAPDGRCIPTHGADRIALAGRTHPAGTGPPAERPLSGVAPGGVATPTCGQAGGSRGGARGRAAARSRRRRADVSRAGAAPSPRTDARHRADHSHSTFVLRTAAATAVRRLQVLCERLTVASGAVACLWPTGQPWRPGIVAGRRVRPGPRPAWRSRHRLLRLPVGPPITGSSAGSVSSAALGRTPRFSAVTTGRASIPTPPDHPFGGVSLQLIGTIIEQMFALVEDPELARLIAAA